MYIFISMQAHKLSDVAHMCSTVLEAVESLPPYMGRQLYAHTLPTMRDLCIEVVVL